MIHQAGGTFLIGLKNNQAILLEDMKFYIQTAKPIFQSEEWEKGHGRIEYRKYELYDISHQYFDSRWEKVGFCSLVKVERKRINTKTQEENKEISFYISNKNAKIGEELFKAIFIFNALNSIQDFIMLSEKENAQHYLGKFATLMRGFLDSSSKATISLEKELPLLKSYIELEGLRLGEEFSYEIIFDEKIDEEEVEEIEIPPLLIQPYLENAFKHGLLHKAGEKKLTLEFSKIERTNDEFSSINYYR